MRLVKSVLLLLLCSCSSSAPQSARHNGDITCDAAQRTGTLPREVREASGVAISSRNAGILWVHNDDDPAVLFAVDSTGALKGKVAVPVHDVDWEDIAVAPCGAASCVYIADIGDNRQTRADRAIYMVPEPLIGDANARAALRFPFHMPGKSQDAEALFVMPDGTMYIVTKGRSGPITLYEFPQPAQPNVDVELKPAFVLSAGLVQLPDLVTGAGVTPDGAFIVIRSYSGFQLYHLGNDTLKSVLPQAYDLTPLREPQGEGVDIRADGTLFFVSERGFGDAAPPISRVQCHLAR